MDNCYRNGMFLIELRNIDSVLSFYSALLHEYVHYMQDTCTYFGIKQRFNYYHCDNQLEMIEGCDIYKMNNPYFEPEIKIFNDKILLGKSFLGYKAIKENMAF